MKKRGSILIIAIVLLVAIEILILVYIGVAKSLEKTSQYAKLKSTALYNAEAGVNAVMNILMRDPDNDFTTEGDKSEKNGYYPPVPYPTNFNFNTLDYQVVVLNSTSNPISNTLKKTGVNTNVDYFDPTPRSIWIKATGYAYPGGVEKYKRIIASGNASKIAAYKAQIVKRTVICKIVTQAPPPPPAYPFNHAMFSCGKIDETGIMHVDGDVCAPTVETHLLASNDSECSDGQQACDSESDSLTKWIDETCADPATIHHPSSETNIDFLKGGYGGTHCFESDLDWAGISAWQDPVDANGDGDYNDPGDVPPPVLIVKGDLTITGIISFKGIIVCEGKIKITTISHFEGTIIGMQGIDFTSISYVEQKDYTSRVVPEQPPYQFDTKVDKSAWYLADKPMRMSLDGKVYEITAQPLPVPNP